MKVLKIFLLGFLFLFTFSIFSNYASAALEIGTTLNITPFPATYSPGKEYTFNISVVSTLANETINEVLFYTNITGVDTAYNETTSTPLVINVTGGNTNANYSITFVDLPAQTFFIQWIANNNGTDTYSTAKEFYSINKGATLTRLYLNGTEGNKAYNATQVINITVTLNVTGKTVKIDTNFTGTLQLLDSGTTPLENITTTPAVVFDWYNITGYFEGDQNYTASFQTYYINVTDNTLPTVTFIPPSPPPGEYGARTVTFNCSATDNVGLSSINITVWFENGTVYQSWVTTRTGLSNFTNITHSFPRDILAQANKTFFWSCKATDAAGNSTYIPGPPPANRTLITAVSDLFGYVKNTTGQPAENVNVSIYRFIFQPGGPPLEEYVISNLTDSNGFFVIRDVNVSMGQSSDPPLFTVYFTLYSATGNATEVGPILPPFPRELIFKEEPPGYPLIPPPGAPPTPGLNGSTVYLQPAATLRLYAHNSTHTLNFGYEVIDQKLGFPVKSCVLCNVNSVDVVVPRDRNYTVVFLRDPQIFGVEATPPIHTLINNISLYSGNEYVVIVNQTLEFSEYRLYGYISNITAGVSNITILPKLIPWPGFIPPIKAEIEEFNISKHINYTKGAEEGKLAFYNISVMGSPTGIEYFIEFYGNTSTEYFAAFANVTIKGNTELNVTLTKLAGTYTVGGDVNTSKVTIQLQNSTGHNITTDAHVKLEVKHPSFYGNQPVYYIIEELINGSFSMPFLNDSKVRVMVFSQGYAPRATKLNLSKSWVNITLERFDMEFVNETGDFDFNTTEKEQLIELIFYRYGSECNVVNPPDTCKLTNATGMFDPFQIMMAGRVNLMIRIKSTNVTLYFINIDLLASGPPDAEISKEALSTISTTNTFEQAWKFGSLAPDIYDYVWVGIPYSGLDETWSYSTKIQYLYDEEWNLIWNVSVNGTNPGDYYHEYADYPTAWFTGISCSKTNSNAYCFMNTTSNYFWLKIPHFSGIQPIIVGTAPPAPSVTPSLTTITIDVAAGILTRTFLSITPTIPKRITEPDLKSIGLNLTEIYISVKTRVTNVKITIERLVKHPADVAVEIENPVYEYIKITSKNLEEENIEKIKIKFKVRKSWISDNNIDETTIALLRFANNVWNKLPTQKISEDNTYIYFEAETPGFSYFAISGEKITVAPPAPVCGNNICEAGEDYTTCPQDCPPPLPECECTSWENIGCGISPCKQNQMKQTRSCTPAKCDIEERCIEDVACIPPKPIISKEVIAVVIVIIILILIFLVKKGIVKF